MPTISRIRLTNVIYENNAKRYNDQVFEFDGKNGIFLLENGGGKTVFLQTVMQAIIPNVTMADRKIKETLMLDNNPAHIAIEWILNEKPRRYGITAVSLYMENNDLKSYKYVYNHGAEDNNSLEKIPFVVKNSNFKERPASKGEISEYYLKMKQQHMNANLFVNVKDYHKYIEENFKIIPGEWYKIALINSSEGGIEEFFKNCNTTQQLLNNLLIPTVEDALEGSEKIDFVQTFEKQREHFKQNKRLTEEIEQFQSIKERVDVYVTDYQKLHESDLQYNIVKQEAKALNRYVIEKLDDNQKKQEELDKDWKTYEKAEHNYLHKVMSLEIAQLDQEIETYENEKNELCNIQSDLLQELHNKKMRIQNIEITDLKEKKTISEKQISSLEEQLITIKQSEEEMVIKEKIKNEKAKIRGKFIDLQENLDKKQGIAEAQRKREMDVLVDVKEKIEKKNTEIINHNGIIKGLESSISIILQDMEQIKGKLYEGITEENASNFLSRYKKKATEIEEELRQEELKRKELHEIVEQLENKRESYQEKLMDCQSKLSGLEMTKEEMNKRQRNVMLELEEHFHNLGIFDSVYSKEMTIRDTVEDRLMRLEAEFEDLLLRERINSRLADMYGDMPYFVADSLVAKKMNMIANQASFAELGSVYVDKNSKHLGGDLEAIYKKYPYWASTIVTTTSDKARVIEYMETLRHELTYPVFIITTGEVQQIFSDKFPGLEIDNKIFPVSWVDNLEKKQFELWKERRIQEAKVATEERGNVGQKIQEIRSLKEKVETYFHHYPYHRYQELQENIKEMEDGIKTIKYNLKEVSEQRNKKRIEGNNIDKHIHELNQEKPDIDQRIILVNDFMKLTKDKTEYGYEKREEEKKYENLQREYQRLKVDLSRQEAILEEISKECRTLQHEINKMESDELYVKVMTFDPEFTEEELLVLKDRLSNLERELMGFSGLAREMEIKIQNEREKLGEIEKTLKRTEKNAKFPILEIISYEEEELDRLHQRVNKLETDNQKQGQKIEKVSVKIATISGNREKSFSLLKEKFDDLYLFEEELFYVEEKLTKEKSELGKEKKDLEKRTNEIKELLTLYESAKQELAVMAAEHRFASIELERYQKDKFLNFEYDKKKMIAKIKENLNHKAKNYQMMLDAMEHKKKEYLNFCRSRIKEPKLKDTAMKGIEKKRNYAELLEYQKKMSEILSKSIKIAEDDRRESDGELQTFLAHLVTYSKNVINEIDDIQNKTKIKVDGKPKQVYHFIIPKWDDIEAKEVLRVYINQLVTEYDNLGEDKESVKKHIENKLSVKNLLMSVLGDKSIKIKCRKVTNDLQVGQAPMNWESSNKWSGGEKWSKNMTLFLSILNYLAEKKQYMSVNQKRHRTVILDNPFGKASSKHVLDPVFFVAENLGFQMITVTAHAEGQFVTDYFPVVYSGKLRSSSDAEKQIMDVTKTLNTAYFKSESLDTFMRFDDNGQMTFNASS